MYAFRTYFDETCQWISSYGKDDFILLSLSHIDRHVKTVQYGEEGQTWVVEFT